MGEDNNKNKNSGKLSLGKNFGSGTVKQSISKGKSKTVTVEVKKSRNFKLNKPGSEQSRQYDDGLTESEREARLEAIKKAEEARAQQKEEEQEKKVIGKSKIEVSESAKDKREILKKNQEKEKEEKKKEKENIKEQIDFENANISSSKPKKKGKEEEKDDDKASIEDAKAALEREIEEKKKKSAAKPKRLDESKHKKLTITQLLDPESEERVRSFSMQKKKKDKKANQLGSEDQEFVSREIIIPEFITVQELASRMSVRIQDVLKELMKLGVIKRAVEEIDTETAELLVTEFNHIPKVVAESDIESLLDEENIPESDLKSRPAIVTVMGHVDHGKTSLLDALRQANVTGGEAGGITQHIGAYQVTAESGDKITFIDTPGHAAFTAMRARGADITDIVILIVAADDGIMPQTIEAINHAKAAEVPIIVAINKIDKPEANPQKAKEALLNHEIIPEEYGGDIQVVEISAKERINLDGLIDAVLIQAELLELKASDKQKPRGTVIEARIDKGKGVVATLLVQKGTLNKGDLIVAGTAYGKVKTISDEHGKDISEGASPSKPVEVLGFDEVPAAGEEFALADSEKIARDVVEYRKKLQLIEKNKIQQGGNSLESLFKSSKEDNKQLNIIVKADVHGSVEAIVGAADKIETEEIDLKIVHTAAGAITESDVQLALATKAVILGFNVRAEANAKEMAERENVDIRYYNIIYNLIDDLRALVSGMLSPTIREELIGYAKIEQVFKITKVGKVAGCKVTEGTIKRGAGVRLLRDNVVIHEGKLKTLKRFKEEVPEVKEGFECGMAFENYEDIKDGDMIEAFEIIEEQRQLAESK